MWLGNNFFRFFDIDIATAITLSGQYVNKTAELALNNGLNTFTGITKDRIIAMDTDSCYMCVEDVITKFNPKDPISFLNEFGNRFIQPKLNEAFESLAKKTNAFKLAMNMKREAIANRAIWLAGKNYIINVFDSEGVRYAEPKIKMKGISAVKSSTPKVCRDEFKKIFKMLMNETEEATQIEIERFKDEFFKLPVEAISKPSGTTDIRKWTSKVAPFYISKTPIHCRASIMFNRRRKDLGLENRFPEIKNGDRIKFVHLKLPNPIKENVIGYSDILPSEFGLHKFVDYDTQFFKEFIKPLDKVLTCMGWTSKRVSNLDAFFD